MNCPVTLTASGTAATDMGNTKSVTAPTNTAPQPMRSTVAPAAISAVRIHSGGVERVVCL